MENFFQDLRTGSAILYYHTLNVHYFIENVSGISRTNVLALLYIVNGIKIKSYTVKPVGNKISGFLLILDNSDWLTLIWSSS